MVRGGPQTQHGTRPTHKDGTEETALQPQLSVAERVHAPPQSLEPSRRHSVLDRARLQPTRLELPKRHNTELTRCDRRDCAV